MIEVRRVESKKDLLEFIKLPFKLYKDDPFWAGELLHDQKQYFSLKNPFIKKNDVKLFIALKNGVTLGRIASILNRAHIEKHNERTGFFGFFESVNDGEVSSKLLQTVENTLIDSGMNSIRGPMNFSTNEQCGFLIEGFDTPPMIMTPHNPGYYNQLLEASGYKKAKDLLAFITDVPEKLPDKVERVASIARKNGVITRRVTRKTFYDDLKAFQEIYNDAWKDNWGFVPLEDDELQFLGKRLKPVFVPELTLVAEKNGEPIGFLGLLPDFNRVLRRMKGKLSPVSVLKAIFEYRKIKELRLLLLGIRPKYRNRGVDALLFSDAFPHVRGKGYERVEFSWILEDNLPVIRLVEMIEGRLYKKFRVYEKSV